MMPMEIFGWAWAIGSVVAVLCGAVVIITLTIKFLREK